MTVAVSPRVLEFYCGIGGMHYALKELFPHVDAEVVASFDINTTTNAIYRHNFPETKLCQNNIQSITAKAFDKFAADLWTMSPPCQPFTLKGNQLGADDRRCDSLKALLDRLREMTKRPGSIFLENVVGFDGTSMHANVLETLAELDYKIEEFVLSPVQLGIPNSRPRYYLLARMKMTPSEPAQNGEQVSREIKKAIPDSPTEPSSSVCEYLGLEGSSTGSDGDEDEEDGLVVDPNVIGSAAVSIVDPSATSTACFTKSYGQYLVGCGSYLRREDGRIRRFSPREVSRLMSFPPSFSWPEGTTTKQLYRALGNSVNVRVVTTLLARLLGVSAHLESASR